MEVKAYNISIDSIWCSIDITTTVGIGQRVVQVEATDKDKLFGPIIYELNIESGKALNFFGIDKTSGEVVTQASFLNSIGENFTFTVVAKDNGGLPIYHSAEATVTVSTNMIMMMCS